MDKSEALRLADALVYWHGIDSVECDAAIELRRLHADVQAREDEIKTHSAAVYEATKLLSEVRAQRDALLALLGRIRDWHHLMDAAIAAAEGEKT